MGISSRGTGFALVLDRRDPAAVESLLRALPAWFGIEESTRAYVAAARRLPTILAVDEAAPHGVVGALLWEQHPGASVEIHLMAVHPGWHRRGVGRALVAAAELAARSAGNCLLSVKTLGASDPDPGYAATRRFYAATGFLAVEELADLWPGTPCLLMVKPLAPS